MWPIFFRVRSDPVLSEDQDLAASPVPEGEHEVRAGDRVRLHADGCQRGRIPHQEGDARSRRVHHRGGSNIATYKSWFRHCSFDYRLRLSLISAMSMEMVQSIWMNLLVIFYCFFPDWPSNLKLIWYATGLMNTAKDKEQNGRGGGENKQGPGGGGGVSVRPHYLWLSL